jgi:transposase-like protein
MIGKLKCPHCNSERINKSETGYWNKDERQEYYCNSCHEYTIKPISINEYGRKIGVK